MKIGNVSLNPAAFKEYTKEQFFNEFAGKLSIDKEIVWQNIVKENKCETAKELENESFSKPSKSSKKS